MTIKNKLVVLFILSFLVFDSNAQNNIHFSQYYNVPMYLNPALAGQFDDLYRVNGIIRQQWSGTGGDASYLYQTKGGGIDFSLWRKKLGVGVFVLLDQSGGGIFNTTKLMPNLSYSFELGDNSLSFGVQPLISLSSLDISKITTQNPDDFKKSSSYFDLNGGINYKHDFGDFEANIGVATSNIVQAKESFMKTGTASKVDRTYKSYLNIDWELTDKLKCLPGVYFAMESSSKNIVFGSNFSYKLIESGEKGMRIIGGLWGRSNSNNFESLIPKVGIQMNKIQVMASYDYNMTFSKGGASHYIDGLSNTFELSIIMTGRPKSLPPLGEDIFLLNPRF